MQYPLDQCKGVNNRTVQQGRRSMTDGLEATVQQCAQATTRSSYSCSFKINKLSVSIVNTGSTCPAHTATVPPLPKDGQPLLKRRAPARCRCVVQPTMTPRPCSSNRSTCCGRLSGCSRLRLPSLRFREFPIFRCARSIHNAYT